VSGRDSRGTHFGDPAIGVLALPKGALRLKPVI
jgi:hypothetical protein